MLRALKVALVSWLLADLGKGCGGKPFGTTHITVTGPDGRLICRGSRTALDPAEDHRITEAALTFVEAINARGVNIPPEVMYRTLVGRYYSDEPADSGFDTEGLESSDTRPGALSPVPTAGRP